MKLAHTLSLAIFAITLFSCTKSSNQVDVTENDKLNKDEIRLFLSFAQEGEVEDENATYNPKVASSINSSNAINQENVVVSPSINYEGIEIFPTVNYDERTYIPSSRQAQSNDQLQLVADTRNTANNLFKPLNKDFTVRILFYEKNSSAPNGFGRFFQSAQFKMGDSGKMNGTVTLKKDLTYKYIVYTLNDTQDIPDVENKDNPTFTTFVNRDFAYNIGEITTPKQKPTDTGNETMSFPTPIDLIRQVARVGIAVNTLGMFAEVNSARVALPSRSNSFKKGVFDLKTGDYKSISPSDYTGTALEADITHNISKFGDKKVAYFYTAENDNIEHLYSDLSVIVKNFTIKLDWRQDTRSFGEGAPGGKSQEIKFAKGIKVQRGITYYGTINMVESAIEFAGVKWARSNLMFNSTNNFYGFRHYPDRRYEDAGGNVRGEEFWRLGAPTPDGNSDANVDPCRNVYPQNLWLTASRDDWNALYNVSGNETGTTATTRRKVITNNSGSPYWSNFTGSNTAYYVGYKTTTKETSYPLGGDLIFSLGGVVRNNGNYFKATTANYFPREYIVDDKRGSKDVFAFNIGNFTIGTQNKRAGDDNEIWTGWVQASPSAGRPFIRCVRNPNDKEIIW